MEIFIVLGLCFVLYEALDLFQGCYQHYHHSGGTAGNSSLANIEKHNKSVLSRANKIIKDIIVEDHDEEVDEDEQCLIDEEARDPELAIIVPGEDRRAAEEEDEGEEEGEDGITVDDGNVELKKRLLLKMELLNEKSSLVRPQTQLKRREEATKIDNAQSKGGDNESHFATNLRNGGGDWAKDEFEPTGNVIRVFSVSECVQ